DRHPRPCATVQGVPTGWHTLELALTLFTSLLLWHAVRRVCHAGKGKAAAPAPCLGELANTIITMEQITGPPPILAAGPGPFAHFHAPAARERVDARGVCLAVAGAVGPGKAGDARRRPRPGQVAAGAGPVCPAQHRPPHARRQCRTGAGQCPGAGGGGRTAG